MLFYFDRSRIILQRALRAAVASHRPGVLRALVGAHGHRASAKALAGLSGRVIADALSMLAAPDRAGVLTHLPRAARNRLREVDGGGAAQAASVPIRIAPVLLTIACVGLALGGCDANQPSAAQRQAETASVQREGTAVIVPSASPLRESLEVGGVEQEAFALTIDAPGVIEAMPEKLVKITPPLAGRIVRLHRQLGDTVKAGDALATLDSAELGTAYNEHVKAQAALQQARLEFTRQKELLDEDIAPRKDFEAAQLALSAAESDARATADRLAQLGADVGAASRREYVMRSPIAGRVVEIEGSQGGFWNDTTASIMTVADLSTVWLSASIAEKDLAQIFVGQTVRIVPNAYANREFSGTVQYVGDLLDPETRTIRVRVAIANPEGLFKPGMFARVSFSGANHQALLVPASALLQSGLYTRVFVEQEPFRYESRVVSVGASAGDRVEVLSGLRVGERIVTKNAVLLND